MEQEKLVVKDLLDKFNAAVAEKNGAEISRVKTLLDEAMIALNNAEKSAAFGALLALENPGIEIVKQGFIELSRTKNNKETGLLELSKKMEIIDVVEIDKLADKPIFAAKNFGMYMEALNHAIVNRTCARQGITKRGRLDKFQISAMAKMLEISSVDVETEEGVKQGLQNVVSSIVPGIEISDSDRNAFIDNYSTWSNKTINGVKMCTENNFRRMVMRVMSKSINGNEYVGE